MDFNALDQLLDTIDSTTAWSDLLTADYLYNSGQSNQADSLLASIDPHLLNPIQQAQYFYDRAAKYIWSFDRAELTLAVAYLDTSLILLQNQSNLLRDKLELNKAIALINLEELEKLNKAKSILERLQADGHTPAFIKIIAWYQSGRIAFSQGDQQLFLEANLNCNRINEEIDFWGPQHPYNIAIKNSIGMSYKEVGDYKTAIYYLEDVVNFYKDKNPASYFDRLLNLASIHQEAGNTLEAKKLYEEILAAPGRSLDTLFYQVRNNYSEVLFELGEVEQSLRIALDVLQAKKRLLSPDNRSLHIAYLNIANLYFRAHDFDKAIHYYDQLFSETTLMQSSRGGNVNKALLGLGNAYREIGQLEQARHYFTLAVQSSQIDQDDMTRFQPEFILTISGHLESTIELFVVEADSLGIEDLLRRASYINQVITYAFENYESRVAKLNVYKTSKHYFDWLILYYHKRYQASNSETIADAMMNQIEFSKSAFYRSKMNRKHLFSSIPNGSMLQDSIQNLEKYILASQKEILDNPDSQEKIIARSNLLNYVERKRDLTDRIYAEAPKLFLSTPQLIALPTIQQRMRQANIDLLFSYYYSDDYLIYTIISPTGFKTVHREVALSPLINEYMRSFFSIPLGQDITQYQKQSNSLFKLLFDAPIDTLTNLLIIPFNKIATVPMHSLITEIDTSQNTFRYLNYFNRLANINQHFSLLAFSNENKTDEPKSSYLGLAPSFKNTRYDELPFAGEEIETASTILNGIAFIESKANRKVFMNQGIQSEILHLATHAFVDSTEPLLNSHFLLSSDESSDFDPVYAYNLYGMDIHAKLTILSACNTGSGKIEEGEGVSSLARAFFYAGCPNVLMSLWPANDFAAKEIITGLSENLKNANALGDAFNFSSQRFLEEVINSQFTHPYFWSNFVLISDGSYIFSNKKSIAWIWIPGLFIVVGLFFMIFKRKITLAPPSRKSF